MKALVALLMLTAQASAQQFCPNPSAGFTIALTPEPKTNIYDSQRLEDTFIFTNGATHTFFNVPQGVPQNCNGGGRNGPKCYSAVYGIYRQGVLSRQWSCPILTATGAHLVSAQ